MPFPRAGCHTCKIRRIKCDNTQPKCQRCTGSHRICLPTSANQAPFLIHFENYYASGTFKRPRGPRSTITASSSGTESAVLQCPSFDLQTRALMHYVHCHLHTLTDIPSMLQGISNCVPAWISKTKNLMVDLAICSMALAVFSRTQRYPPAAIAASRKYQELLRIVQVTIATLDERNIDACLLTVFLMSRYEDTIHRPGNLNSNTPFAQSIQSFSHHDGASAILKIWKDRLSSIHPATDIIKQTRRGLIRSAILRKLALPEWMLDGSLFGEHGLELDYDRIIVRVTNVLNQLSSLFQQEADSQATSYELLSRSQELDIEARDINKDLEKWTAKITLIGPCPLPGDNLDFLANYSHPDPTYAALWNYYFATRMLVLNTRLRILKFRCLHSDIFAHEQQLDYMSDINIMADNLASNVPFCLQRFKVADSPNSSSCNHPITLTTNEEIKPYIASLMVWPLSIASCLEGVDILQRLWFKKELAHLGRIVGAGVLQCAENDRWLDL